MEIRIQDPQKIGDGISSYLTYHVVTRTNIGLFRKKEMSVVRRFSDFLGLHEKLAEKYLHKGRLVPAPPEKNVVGMLTFNIDSSPIIVSTPMLSLTFPVCLHQALDPISVGHMKPRCALTSHQEINKFFVLFRLFWAF